MKNYYLPFDKEKQPDLFQMVEDARKRNLARDRMEREGGFMVESDCPIGVRLRTIISAMGAALSIEEEEQSDDTLAEAIALAQDVAYQLRQEKE